MGDNIDRTQSIINYELWLKRKNQINKLILGSFLVIAVVALVMRITVGALLDAGLINNKFHIGFWQDPQLAFDQEFKDWQTNVLPNGTWTQFLDDDNNRAIASIINRHPNFIWFLTQFTWITTIIIILFLIFRFFKFEDTVPRWLKWVMTQRTLSMVTMYEMVVGILFWASMFNGFSSSFSATLKIPEMIITILVHAIIPICILTYSTIYLIRDKKASILRELFAIKGLIFPLIYACYYIILTIVWNDPYPVTNMHDVLTKSSDGFFVSEADWKEWARKLWVIPVLLIGIYILLGFMTIIHNIILLKFNKDYDPKADYEILKRKERKLDRFKRKLIRSEAKNWNYKAKKL